MSKNILVTGVCGDIGQSIIKCIRDIDKGHRVIATDTQALAAKASKVDRFYQVPLAKQEEEYLGCIKKIVLENDIQYIFPSTEAEIGFFDSFCSQFGQSVKIFINEHGILHDFLDKYNTVVFLERNKLPFPKTFLLEDYAGGLDFPFILKQRRGSGGKGLMPIEDREELAFFKKRKKDFIVQELLGTIDEEYTAAVFSDGVNIHSIAFKRLLGFDNLSKVMELAGDEAIKDLMIRIAKAASLKGVINVQMRKTARGYVPFEINPRLSSTVYVRHRFGFCDLKWWIDYREGRSIEYYQKYKKGIAIRVLDEAFFDLA